jgi:histone H3/H4
MKITRLTERDLNKIVKESVNRIIKEAEDGGWVVDSSEAQEAYDLAVQEMGEETINSAIVRCLSDATLAQCLAYIFRQYDFRQWQSRF